MNRKSVLGPCPQFFTLPFPDLWGWWEHLTELLNVLEFPGGYRSLLFWWGSTWWHLGLGVVTRKAESWLEAWICFHGCFFSTVHVAGSYWPLENICWMGKLQASGNQKTQPLCGVLSSKAFKCSRSGNKANNVIAICLSHGETLKCNLCKCSKSGFLLTSLGLLCGEGVVRGAVLDSTESEKIWSHALEHNKCHCPS